jgi:hypothetical protein
MRHALDVAFLPEEWREGLEEEGDALVDAEPELAGCCGYFDDEGRFWCNAAGTDRCAECAFNRDVGQVPREISEELET